jgi:hypothetical protein
MWESKATLGERSCVCDFSHTGLMIILLQCFSCRSRDREKNLTKRTLAQSVRDLQRHREAMV